MNLQFPPFLHEGDKVAIVSPSSKIDSIFLKGAKTRLSSWGLTPVMGDHVRSSWGSYAGATHQRLKDFQAAMDDEEIKAILCSRGGYGAVHLLDKLDFTRFRNHPKWLIGFSDITALHNLFQYNGFASLHAPPEGTILFIEDVGERPYAIERMMYNLKLGGVLEKLSGLIIGQFTEYKEDYSLKKDLYSTLDALVKEYDFPICYDFPVGHVTENLPLINGAEVEFVSGKKGVELLINPPI